MTPLTRKTLQTQVCLAFQQAGHRPCSKCGEMDFCKAVEYVTGRAESNVQLLTERGEAHEQVHDAT